MARSSSLNDPACPKCDATTTTIRLNDNIAGTWECLKCAVHFYGPEGVAPGRIFRDADGRLTARERRHRERRGER